MDATQRFSTRVESYRRFRPRYPAAMLPLLRRDCGLSAATEIADVAAGTGLLAELFLENGNPVVAIEPNAPMRSACAALIPRFPRLRCIDGTAEATGLPAQSVDMVTIGQALHWFDRAAARAELARVLRPGGWCVVVYNNRRESGDTFHSGYERILRTFGIDYGQVRDRYMDRKQLEEFFAPARMHQAHLPNVQELGLEEMTERILSSSYMPQNDHPAYPDMVREIETLFAACQQGGRVRMEYDTEISYGQLAGAFSGSSR